MSWFHMFQAKCSIVQFTCSIFGIIACFTMTNLNCEVDFSARVFVLLAHQTCFSIRRIVKMDVEVVEAACAGVVGRSATATGNESGRETEDSFLFGANLI